MFSDGREAPCPAKRGESAVSGFEPEVIIPYLGKNDNHGISSGSSPVWTRVPFPCQNDTAEMEKMSFVNYVQTVNKPVFG